MAPMTSKQHRGPTKQLDESGRMQCVKVASPGHGSATEPNEVESSLCSARTVEIGGAPNRFDPRSRMYQAMITKKAILTELKVGNYSPNMCVTHNGVLT